MKRYGFNIKGDKVANYISPEARAAASQTGGRVRGTRVGGATGGKGKSGGGKRFRLNLSVK